MGIGDWGLGIGDWGLGPIPNSPSTIPNPHISPYQLSYYKLFTSFYYLIYYNLLF